MLSGRRSTWLLSAFLAIALWSPGVVRGETNAEKTFSAVVTDSQGVETELKNVLFYWEEKISETAFVPHELKHIPVKRGSATVNVKFGGIKTVEVRPGGDKNLPILTIVLANGNSGEFTLALSGSIKGLSDFGEVELPATAIRKIVFK
jgi:hypothetical protein